jgi:hypothetical protein
MEKGRDRAAAHFGLAQGNAGHLAPSQGGSVGGGSPPASKDIAPNPLNTPHKGIKPCDEDRDEEQRLEQLKTHCGFKFDHKTPKIPKMFRFIEINPRWISFASLW